MVGQDGFCNKSADKACDFLKTVIWRAEYLVRLSFLPAIIHNFEGEAGGVCLTSHSSAALDLHSLKAIMDWSGFYARII